MTTGLATILGWVRPVHGLGGAWFVLVLWAAWTKRPARGRVGALVETSAAARRSLLSPPDGSQRLRGPEQNRVVVRLAHAFRSPATTVGWLVRRALGLLPDPEADARLGLAIVAGAATATVALPLALPVASAVWCLPWWAQRRARRRLADQVLDELPDAIDLLRLSLGTGTSLRLALTAVAPRCPPTIAAALERVQRRLHRGAPMVDALDELRALGGQFQPVLDALVRSEQHGAPITSLLDRIADDARGMRRRRAEELARRIPVKLLFPLVFCTLPAFGLLTVVPLLASALGRFSI